MARIPLTPETPIAPAHSDVPMRPAREVLTLCGPIAVEARYHAAIDLWAFDLGTQHYLAQLPQTTTDLALHVQACPTCQAATWRDAGQSLYVLVLATLPDASPPQ